jgi:hypothetical protein
VTIFGKLALAAAVLGASAGSLTGSAGAQARQVLAASGASALSVPPPPPGDGPARASASQDDTGREPDPTPMSSLGIGFKLGVAGMGTGTLEFQRNGKSYPGRIESRRGVYLSVPLQVGGEGFGWMFEPYYSRASVGTLTLDASGRPTGSVDSDTAAYGLYTGPTVHFHVVRSLYVGVGAGVKTAYVSSSGFNNGVDLYGRVPVSATYYLTDQVALVAELGLGYGLSAYFSDPRTVVDPVTKRSAKVDSNALYGKSLTWDCTIGVRLP